MNRKTILNKINNLEQTHCKGCKIKPHGKLSEKYQVCLKHCEIGLQIKELGDQYSSIRQGTVKEILAKGDSMTKSDIAFLLKREVPKKDIQKAVGLYNGDFSIMMHAFGFANKYKKAVKK